MEFVTTHDQQADAGVPVASTPAADAIRRKARLVMRDPQQSGDIADYELPAFEFSAGRGLGARRDPDADELR